MYGGDKKIVSIAFTILVAFLFFLPSVIFADQYDDFITAGQQHNIISNEHFLDTNGMNTSSIQSFLEERSSYLASYSDGGRSAAQIIYDAAHGKNEAGGTWNGVTINESTGTINPEVILVFLQKEQSLISRSTYDEWAMTASMGYYCYAGVSNDNNGNNCNDNYEGFTKQVENGAWQLRYNYEIATKDSSWWSSVYPGAIQYRTGNTATMGTSRTPPSSYDVTFSNQATASCYRYTPYVFFGNYNVWNLFYNTYDFDSSSAPPINTDDNIGNDTSPYSNHTFDSVINISGSKNTACRAYYNATLIADLGSSSWSYDHRPGLGVSNDYIYYKDSNGNQLSTKHIFVDRHKTGDINGDLGINIIDLSILASNWEQDGSGHDFVDLNRDGTVNIIDLSILASNWTG